MSILAYKLARLGVSAGVGLDEFARHATRAEFPVVGETDTLYFDEASGCLWWWNGTGYRAVGWDESLTARRLGTKWEYLAGDLPSWVKGTEWTGGYPLANSEISLFGTVMKFDGSFLTTDDGLLSRSNISPGLNLAGGVRIGILVYAHRLNPTCGITLRIGIDASNYKYYRFQTVENTLVEGWNFLVVHTQEDGAMRLLQAGTAGNGWEVGLGAYNFETQAASYMALQVTGLRAPNYPILWVGSILYGGKENLPMITLGFDITENFDLNKSILDQYGFKGYLAVGVTSQVGRDKLVSLYNAGWDIIGHTASHESLGQFTDKEAIYTQLNTVRTQLLAMGMRRGANLFASPNGSWSNKSIYVLASNGFHWHRAVTNAPLAQYDCSIGHLNPLTQGSFSCGAITATALKARADLLLQKYKANCHFYSHDVVPGGNGTDWPTNTSNIYSYTLDSLCAHLKTLQDAGLCKVVTPSEYVAISGGGGDPMDAFRVPNTAALVVPASPAVITNVTNKSVIYVVSGGTVSALELSFDGSAYISLGQTAGAFTIEPGCSLRITYTAVPIVTQIRQPAQV